MEVGEVIECLFSYYNVLTPFKCSLISVDTFSAVPGEAKVKLTPNKKKRILSVATQNVKRAKIMDRIVKVVNRVLH